MARVISHVAQKPDMDPSPFCSTAVIEFLHFWHLNETDTRSHDVHAVSNVILLIFCQLSHYRWHTSPLQEDRAIIAYSRSAINGGNSFLQWQYLHLSFEIRVPAKVRIVTNWQPRMRSNRIYFCIVPFRIKYNESRAKCSPIILKIRCIYDFILSSIVSLKCQQDGHHRHRGHLCWIKFVLFYCEVAPLQ